MKSLTLRVGLSFIVGLGCWFGKLEAQTKGGPATPLTPVDAGATSAVEIVEDGPRERRRILPVAFLQRQPVRDTVQRSEDCLNRHGYCCDQNPNAYGCGGCHAWNIFVFGSCRTFFGESCQPKIRGANGIFGGDYHR